VKGELSKMKVYRSVIKFFIVMSIICAGIANLVIPISNATEIEENDISNNIVVENNVTEENTVVTNEVTNETTKPENGKTDDKTNTNNNKKKKKYATQKGYIRAVTTVILRKKASNSSAWVATLKAGQKVYVLGSTKGWYKVKTLKGKKGYVKKKNIGTKTNKKYKLLATYTTYSVGSPANRNFNMKKAAKLINKSKLKKGKTFNWAKVVGPCGGRQGYRIANCIIAGKVVPGYGGGVCQVATTMYGCSKKLKCKTIERHNHSNKVSYLNKDRYEAAISYGHKNLRFKNTTKKSIKFDVYVTKGRVIVAAYQIL